jgi:hypothetical protein
MKDESKIALIKFGLICFAAVAFYNLILKEDDADKAQRLANKEIQQQSENKQLAFYTAHTFVERHLLAPASADFENYRDGCTTFTPPNIYKISSHVDSKNAFGVPLRMSYHATLQQTSPDKYTCKLLVIDNKVFIQ